MRRMVRPVFCSVASRKERSACPFRAARCAPGILSQGSQGASTTGEKSYFIAKSRRTEQRKGLSATGEKSYFMAKSRRTEQRKGALATGEKSYFIAGR